MTAAAQLIVGAFFADDAIICQIASTQTPNTWSQDPEKTFRVPIEGGHLEEACEALGRALVPKLDGREIGVLAIATPGPIIPIIPGIFTPAEAARSRTRIGESGRALWNGKNLAHILAKALSPAKIKAMCWHLDVEALAEGNFARCFAKTAIGGDLAKIWAENPYVFILADQGINATILSRGSPIRGLNHSEVGHIFVQRYKGDKQGPSCCRLHRGDCLTGVASLAALEKRWGMDVDAFQRCGSEHDVVVGTAFYFAQLIVNMIMIAAPRHIVLGGRIADHPGFMSVVHEWVRATLSVPGQPMAPLFPGYEGIQRIEGLIRKLDNADDGVYGCLIAGRRFAHQGTIPFGDR